MTANVNRKYKNMKFSLIVVALSVLEETGDNCYLFEVLLKQNNILCYFTWIQPTRLNLKCLENL